MRRIAKGKFSVKTILILLLSLFVILTFAACDTGSVDDPAGNEKETETEKETEKPIEDGEPYTPPYVPYECEHVFVFWSQTDYCTNDGVKLLNCEKCGSLKSEQVLPAGHKWSDSWYTDKSPTETTDGLKRRSCTRCRQIEQQVIAKNSKKLTYNYDKDAGSVLFSDASSSWHENGVVVTLTAVPNTEERFLFDGWYDKSGGKSELLTKDLSVTVTMDKNQQLEAKFVREDVGIVVDAGEHGLISLDSISSGEYPYKSFVDVSFDADSGYKCEGIYVDDVRVSDAAHAKVQVFEGITIEARYEKITGEVLGSRNANWYKLGSAYHLVKYLGEAADIIIPDSYKGLPVTVISTEAFFQNTVIETVQFPAGLEEIGRGAFFSCTSLKSVLRLDSLKKLGNSAFRNCTSLTEVASLGKIEKIGSVVFEKCENLAKITLPDTLKVLDDGALNYTKIESLTLPAALETIEGDHVFFFCDSLKEIIVAEGNKHFYVDEYGVLYKGTVLVRCPPKKELASYDILDGTTEIMAVAFCRNETLLDVNIPDSVYIVSQSAFVGSALNVETVQSPGMYAYYYKNILLYAVTRISYYPPREFFVREGTTIICDNAFRTAHGIKEVVLPTGLKSINRYAFNGSNVALVLELPDTVLYAELLAGIDTETLIIRSSEALAGGLVAYNSNTGKHMRIFVADDLLEYYTTAENWNPKDPYNQYSYYPLSAIGADGVAIYQNEIVGITSDATSFTIPANVDKLSSRMFRFMPSLENIYVDAENKHFKSVDGVLYTKDGSELLVYPQSKTDRQFVVPSEVSKIAEYAFYENKYLRFLELPDGLKEIGNYCLYDTKMLQVILLDNSEPPIASTYSIYSNDSDNRVVLYVPNGSSSAYYNSEVWKVRSEYYSAVLDNVRFENGFLSVAYANFTKLIMYLGNETEVTIPGDINNIAAHAFIDCPQITKLIYPNESPSNHVGAFSTGALSGLSNLETLIIGDLSYSSSLNTFAQIFGKTYYENTVQISQTYRNESLYFSNVGYCVPLSLKLIEIGKMYAVTYGMFMNMSMVESITIKERTGKVEQNAFAFCINLKTINLPAGILEIEDGAFAFCTALESVDFVKIDGEYIGCYKVIDGVVYGREYSIDRTDFYESNGMLPSVLTFGEWDTLVYFPAKNTVEGGVFTVPEWVKNISSYAFNCCSTLKEITISASVEEIREYAFFFGMFEKFNVDLQNQHFIALDGVLYSADMTILYAYPALKTDMVFEMPEGVTEISKGAFALSAFLQEVTICDGITEIPQEAFYAAVSLSIVKLPESVEYIRPSAFYACVLLCEINLPEGLKEIGSRAFYGCLSLSDVLLPESLLKIDSYAFAYCPLPEDFVVPAGTEVNSTAFANTPYVHQ